MAARKRFFRSGQQLFVEGGPSTCMYLISKGTVSIRKKKGSTHIEIARLYSNEVLGELSFFDRRPRSASAVALTDVDALEIDFVSLDKIYKNVPEYLKTIMRSVAERLRRANDVIRRLKKEGSGEEEGKEPAKPADEPNTSEIIASTKDIAMGGAKSEVPDDIPAESDVPPHEVTAQDGDAQPKTGKTG